MYKFLLCWRYLRTRYIALASIISVTLGVATMIVVNSVMEGFTREMQNRIHGILSDVVFESHSLEGFHDPEAHMARIREIAGEYIAGMTPTVVVPAMLAFQVQGQYMMKQVSLIGVDEKTHSQVSDFSQFLQHPANRDQLTFGLREEGYDVHDHQAAAPVPREQMEYAGWKYRRASTLYQREVRRREELERQERERIMREQEAARSAQGLPADAAPGEEKAAEEQAVEAPAEAAPVAEAPSPANPFMTGEAAVSQDFDATKEQHTGIVLGIALACYRGRDGADRFLVLPGDDVKITVPTAGAPPKPVHDSFTVVDFYESKMSEYDSNFVFVPIQKLQEMRGMIDPQTGVGNVTSIQIKLHKDADGKHVRDLLQREFSPQVYGIQTWRDKQGPLLAAVQMETAILNILLFMIIAVAGFGILAIFYMIVVEKTRDIGILKSLGAPSQGIMGIFLAYGLSLGVVGSGVGMVIGLLFVAYINTIADWLGWVTGQEVFDPSIYYFQQIPTIVEPFTVAWIVAGAMLIAVVASILPARRAARLHPVEALRYE